MNSKGPGRISYVIISGSKLSGVFPAWVKKMPQIMELVFSPKFEI
jgi:hypothetical protein